MQPAQGWQDIASWQGQLGPNLMPLDAPANGTRAIQQNEDFRGRRYVQNTIATPSPHLNHEYLGVGMQGSQLGDASMAAPQLPQIQPLLIALPAGAPPPEGAIPFGSALAAGTAPEQPFWQSPGMPPAPAVQGSLAPMMQMIAVPVGEAPPEGAIPVGEFSTTPASTSSSSLQPEQQAWQAPHPVKNAWKIKDPRTGLEVRGPGEEVARRRMRIIDPKTGEEVRPNL